MDLQFPNTIVTIKFIQLNILLIGIEDISIDYLDGQIVQENTIENNIYE